MINPLRLFRRTCIGALVGASYGPIGDDRLECITAGLLAGCIAGLVDPLHPDKVNAFSRPGWGEAILFCFLGPQCFKPLALILGIIFIDQIVEESGKLKED